MLFVWFYIPIMDNFERGIIFSKKAEFHGDLGYIEGRTLKD